MAPNSLVKAFHQKLKEAFPEITQAEIAEVLDVTRQRYHSALQSEITVDKLSEWLAKWNRAKRSDLSMVVTIPSWEFEVRGTARRRTSD